MILFLIKKIFFKKTAIFYDFIFNKKNFLKKCQNFNNFKKIVKQNVLNKYWC